MRAGMKRVRIILQRGQWRTRWLIILAGRRGHYWPCAYPDRSAGGSGNSTEFSADLCDHGIEHLRRESAGVGVLTRAMIAVVERNLANPVRACVRERHGRGPVPKANHDAIVGNSAEC